MLNAADAEAFLIARFGREVSKVSPIGHGEWSRAYAFQRDGAEYIVRFSALDEDFHKDRIAAGYSSRDLPIPAVVEIGETDDGYFAISERASGGFLDDLDGRADAPRCCRPSLPRSMRLGGSICPRQPATAVWGADGIAPSCELARGAACHRRRTSRGSGRTAGGSASSPRPQVPARSTKRLRASMR